MKWTVEDLEALDEAIADGTVGSRRSEHNSDEYPESPDEEQFEGMVFPCELRTWANTRSGDIELKFVVPNKHRLMLNEIHLAARKRLVVHIYEWTPTILDDSDNSLHS